MLIDILKFVRYHKFLQIFTKLSQHWILCIFKCSYTLLDCCIFAMVFLKLLNIVLSGSYLLEYSVAWCVLGECNLPWNQQVLAMWFLVIFRVYLLGCICNQSYGMYYTFTFFIYVLCHILYVRSCFLCRVVTYLAYGEYATQETAVDINWYDTENK